MHEPIAKKSLGQHWLNDSVSLQAICDAAELKPGDQILEIGPGKGSLTAELLKRNAEIFAIEFDREAVSYLQNQFAGKPKLHIEQADIRTFDLTRLPANYKIVANIPYYLTSHLIQLISESQNFPTMAVLLVQKEVAERVCAKPGSMSLLSVSAQFYWETSLDILVPARLFTPPPKVDSQILVLKRRSTPLFDVDQKLFFRIVKAGYASKRKTLLNSLSGGLRADKKTILDMLSQAGISPQLRPQELSLDDWNVLYKQVTSLKLL